MADIQQAGTDWNWVTGGDEELCYRKKRGGGGGGSVHEVDLSGNEGLTVKLLNAVTCQVRFPVSRV